MDYPSGYKKRPIWQWLVIYLIIGGLIYAAIYYFYLSKKGSTPYGSATSTTQTVPQSSITYTSAGFKPGSITINAGDTVTWTNQSGNDISVNSAPHPAHTGYPPLNIGIIVNGASASVTFPTAGTYKFHNHLNSSQSGTIIVK